MRKQWIWRENLSMMHAPPPKSDEEEHKNTKSGVGRPQILIFLIQTSDVSPKSGTNQRSSLLF